MIGMYITYLSSFTTKKNLHPCLAVLSGLEKSAAISAFSLMGIFELHADRKTTGVPIDLAQSAPIKAASNFFRRLPSFKKSAKDCHKE